MLNFIPLFIPFVVIIHMFPYITTSLPHLVHVRVTRLPNLRGSRALYNKTNYIWNNVRNRLIHSKLQGASIKSNLSVWVIIYLLMKIV